MEKKSAWRLSEAVAVALTLNISPKFLEKTRKSHPKKYNTYLVRLEVVEGQKPGTFEFFDEHLGNGQTHNSMMVSAQSFISFAMSEKGWKNLPAGLLEIVQENDIQTADLSTKVARKASDKFIAALIKLLVEIGNRAGKKDKSFDVNAMPGVRQDFHNLASRYDNENFGGLTTSTFNPDFPLATIPNGSH